MARKRATRRKPHELVIVANDVGGLGGMERQTARLVDGLLKSGWSVTVIARTCTLRSRAGLRFVRVAVPRRPFTLAYPVFAIVATMLASRRGEALLHTTGAIVANRADVSSVHYCHTAAREAISARRVTRSNVLYRINSAIGLRLACAGEAWCYRPRRTRMLCAVSRGVARELCTHFPRIAERVRAVPNGVDTSEFKPDPRGGQEFRSTLDISDDVHLALFVGGDWQRKGLRHAIEALTRAPGWHLAVAGEGDRRALSALAAAAGTQERLHLLGRVRDMPRVYAAADAFVFPTSYEAFPLAMLEAAATAVPLLITRVSGAEDMLVDGVNGWFVRPDGRDIAQRLNELGSDASLAQRMGFAARAAAKRFDWETMIAGYLAMYAELAGEDI